MGRFPNRKLCLRHDLRRLLLWPWLSRLQVRSPGYLTNAQLWIFHGKACICAIGLLGKEKSMACQKQHKLLGKIFIPPRRPLKSHYLCPTQPFIHSQTIIEQLPFLSTVGDTKVYKPRRGRKCSLRQQVWSCRGAERASRAGPSSKWVFRYLESLQQTSLPCKNKSFHSCKSPLWNTLRDEMPRVLLGSNSSFVNLNDS